MKTTCKACIKDAERDGKIWGPSHNDAEVCKRVKQTGLFWWEKTPGYFYTEELPRELNKFDREWWPTSLTPTKPVITTFLPHTRKCVFEMTPAQLKAELLKISKYLAHGE